MSTFVNIIERLEAAGLPDDASHFNALLERLQDAGACQDLIFDMGGPKDWDGPLKILLKRMHHAQKCYHSAQNRHTLQALQIAEQAYRRRRALVCKL